MKNNFFSAIQGKFKADFHGRYLGNILEHIAEKRMEIIEPLFRYAPLENKRKWTMKTVNGVSTEVAYLSNESHQKYEKEGVDRRADLAIELDDGKKTGRILVEIKVKDSFLHGQLEEYVGWAQERSEIEDRAVVLLTAFPLKEEEREYIEKKSPYVCHLYLSEFTDRLRSIVKDSELVTLFVDYLCQEGYAMFQLPSKSHQGDDTDYDALLSFLVLTFLPHESGKGKVSTAKKIMRGPSVFGSLVQNWQQVSDRLADLKLGAGRRPTIRYFPEQGIASYREGPIEFDDATLLIIRKQIRKNKKWGRFWLTADTVLDDGVRIEWGQILEVQQGRREDDIDCFLYVLIKKGGVQYSGKFIHLEDGIRNQDLYSVEIFMEKILNLLSQVKNQALHEYPELHKTLSVFAI